jgi:type IV pilus assembly protein PilM
MQRIIQRFGSYFYEDKPLFGLDIDHSTLRVMQVDAATSTPRVKAYGSVLFDPSAIVNDVVVKPHLIAEATLKLFTKTLAGTISTNRVAMSLPASRALSRSLQLPKMNARDIDEAIKTEVEQYIPDTGNLYLDYTVLRETDDSLEVFVVAMPKEIVDSYLTLTRMMGLEAILFDTTIGASARLFAHGQMQSLPSVLVDFGAATTDVSVVHHGLVVTSAVSFGEDNVTLAIAQALHVAPKEVTELKTKEGQSLATLQQIDRASKPFLEQLTMAIRRTIRYYEQRYANQLPISQIVTMGGDANIPQLGKYLTDVLHLPTLSLELKEHIEFGRLPAISDSNERMAYITAAGLAITNPREVFA